MALILLPVCRNTLTWLRSTKLGLFVRFDDNINFHKTIATTIVVAVILHAGNHLACDFPHTTHASKTDFAIIARYFDYKKPTYADMIKGAAGITGISMVVLMPTAFTVATRWFRRNVVKLPRPFNRLTGFNAFWYSHHLLAIVYILLIIHGTMIYLEHKWYKKTASEPPAISKIGAEITDKSVRKSLPKLFANGPYGAPTQDYTKYDVLLLVGLGIGATPFISILKDLLMNIKLTKENRLESNSDSSKSFTDSSKSFTDSPRKGKQDYPITTPKKKKKSLQTTNAYFYWVTREQGSFDWFKGVMNEVDEMDQKLRHLKGSFHVVIRAFYSMDHKA